MAKLIFIGGGPWDDMELDSRVEAPPARIGPGDVVVYVRRAEKSLDRDALFEHCPSRTTLEEAP